MRYNLHGGFSGVISTNISIIFQKMKIAFFIAKLFSLIFTGSLNVDK